MSSYILYGTAYARGNDALFLFKAGGNTSNSEQLFQTMSRRSTGSLTSTIKGFYNSSNKNHNLTFRQSVALAFFSSSVIVELTRVISFCQVQTAKFKATAYRKIDLKLSQGHFGYFQKNKYKLYFSWWGRGGMHKR